ncbi:MAG: T9SS type A sorting domain-containing protein, partial [Salinivirgaceae bacterium]|nr:T9SS type A sorting domain-containing protein [Salinivirgaceae bacterium]
HTYFLMENSGSKAMVTGTMVQHKYKSVSIYNSNRDSLLTQFPGDRVNEALKTDLRALQSGTLLSNYPNPFSGTTQIWYKTDLESQVELVIFDMTGKVVSHLGEGLKEQGTHKAEFVNNGLLAGIYFYSLVIDGIRTDSKKMNIMR